MTDSAVDVSGVVEPIRIGPGLSLRNRLIALETGFHAFVDTSGRPTPEMYEVYAERARGGYGLVYVAATVIDPSYRDRSGLVLSDSGGVSAFAGLADAIRSEGPAAGVQINSHWQADFPYRMSELSVVAIEEMIERHRLGALLAAEAGFDVINLQATHGWPVQRFMSGLCNDRSDRYGDPVYVASRITEVVREAVGDRCAVSWRVSVNEFNENGGLTPGFVRESILPALVDAGADLFDLSLGRGPILPGVHDHRGTALTFYDHVEQLQNFAGFKGAVGVPVSVRGRVVSVEGVVEALRYGDLVGVGRQVIADPGFGRKVLGLDPSPVNTCIACNYCLTRTVKWGLPVRCAVNWGFGRRVVGVVGRVGRRVLVVGGGVSGLSVAVALARSGVGVTVRERGSAFGGVLLGLRELGSLNLQVLYSTVERLLFEARELGVVLELGREVDVVVEAGGGGWDGIVVASGAVPVLPAGVSGDVGVVGVSLPVSVGSVVVLGSGGEGAEVALELADRGVGVVLVDTSLSAVDAVYDYDGKRRDAVVELLEERKVSWFEGAVVEGLVRGGDGGVRLDVVVAGVRESLVADELVVVSRGADRPGWLEGAGGGRDSVEYGVVSGVPVVRVGDCVRPLGIAEAIDAANRAAATVATLT